MLRGPVDSSGTLVIIATLACTLTGCATESSPQQLRIARDSVISASAPGVPNMVAIRWVWNTLHGRSVRPLQCGYGDEPAVIGSPVRRTDLRAVRLPNGPQVVSIGARARQFKVVWYGRVTTKADTQRVQTSPLTVVSMSHKYVVCDALDRASRATG